MCPLELNKKYNFSYIFNKDKIFLCDEHKEININLFQLPENWLSELEGLLQQKNGMGKHLTVYPVLEDFLKIIYHRLHGNLDDLLGPLTDSGHQQIIEKLREEIEYCSEGVYNRASQIIHSFQRPQNLSQLLFQVRQSLVEEKIAPSLTQEIHSWNLVTKTAAIEGLGVKANYVKDKYIGDDKSSLSDTQIKNALKKEFEIFFTPYHLPYLLTAQLRGLLARVGYEGLKEGQGYLRGDAEEIVETIKAYLSKPCQEIEFRKFFIMDEKSYVFIDLDWPNIRIYLLNSLVDEQYFIRHPTYEAISNLFDYACFIDLYPSHADLEINPEFFKKNTLYIELKKIKFEFPAFWEKLVCNSVLICQLETFINQLTKKNWLKKMT